MSPQLTHAAPAAKLLLIAILLASATTAQAGGVTEDCKPKIDKNTVVVNLGIPGYNGGRQVALSFPVNTKEAVTGGTQSAHHAGADADAPSVRYSVNVVEKRGDGALLEVVVVTKPADGPERFLTRSVYVKHNEVVEQLYVGGVSLRASFKMLPFSCKK